MVRRAASTERTRQAILDAATRQFLAEPARDLNLDRIARAAGTTVQTVIRHFGGRDGVFEAALEREMGRVRDERDPAAISTPADAVRQVVAHYERVGERAIRLLAEEHRSPAVASIVDRGRALHWRWCEQVFADRLPARGTLRGRRLAQLVAICDVYTWKLLRRDARLSRQATELAMLELISPILEAAS
jgi:AcrR family transcriptional regulator